MSPTRAQMALHLIEVVHDLEAMQEHLTRDHDGLGAQELGEAVSRLERVKGQLAGDDAAQKRFNPFTDEHPKLTQGEKDHIQHVLDGGQTIPDTPPVAVEGRDVVPLEHLVRVFRCTLGGVRGKMSISRPFPTEQEAKDFYTRTVTVHQAKASRDRDHGYVVVLATQDARSWKKAAERNLTEVENFLVLPASHGRTT